MATRVGRGKIQLAAFDGPFPKTPPRMQKISQIGLHRPRYSQFCPKFRGHGNGGRSGEIAIGSIRLFKQVGLIRQITSNEEGFRLY